MISPSCFAPYMEWSVFPGKAHRLDFSGRHVQTMALKAEVIPSILYCRWVKCEHYTSCLGQVPCFLSLNFALAACLLQASNDFNSPDLTHWIMCIENEVHFFKRCWWLYSISAQFLYIKKISLVLTKWPISKKCCMYITQWISGKYEMWLLKIHVIVRHTAQGETMSLFREYWVASIHYL